MKLALARAMLMNADILLLDEPTNHLDVSNVAWLVNYLTTQCSNVTSLIVSHDSGFLDAVCTGIIHYEKNLKLRKYRVSGRGVWVGLEPRAACGGSGSSNSRRSSSMSSRRISSSRMTAVGSMLTRLLPHPSLPPLQGNLSELVKHKPEAKSYYTLQVGGWSPPGPWVPCWLPSALAGRWGACPGWRSPPALACSSHLTPAPPHPCSPSPLLPLPPAGRHHQVGAA